MEVFLECWFITNLLQQFTSIWGVSQGYQHFLQGVENCSF